MDFKFGHVFIVWTGLRVVYSQKYILFFTLIQP